MSEVAFHVLFAVEDADDFQIGCGHSKVDQVGSGACLEVAGADAAFHASPVTTGKLMTEPSQIKNVAVGLNYAPCSG